eukprot:TRINITY_DN1446_c0_g1_i1.p1 TRINITY_DN1446_c0_g1~~TRINITY_DN1446_c0_g1_i1.p1  ORF type:complete len:455 (+),score=18.50 TRINITY_DN1446_c0_g1_i1:20-1384(+)
MALSKVEADRVLKTFVMWNNKGGVGKSTLTFNVVCEYAKQFPNRKFLVLDMCPQANSSSFFLGGGIDGFKKAETFMANGENTIARFIGDELDHQRNRSAKDYLIRPSDHAAGIPSNIFLLHGDNKLDSIASQLEDKAREKRVLRDSPEPYYVIHTMMRRFIEEVTKEGSWVVFADTNPAFTVYTRMALCSCDQLLVPCNPDEFSVNAVKMITDLLCGAEAPAPYNFTTFAKKASKYNLPLPKLRLVIANRFLVREGLTPRLYQGTQIRLSETVLSVLKNEQNRDFLYPLTLRLPDGSTQTTTGPTVTTQQFSDFYTSVIPLFHSAGVYSSYSGIPMSFMTGGDYSIAEKKTRIGNPPLVSAGWGIQDIITRLEGFQDLKYFLAEVGTAKEWVQRLRPVPLGYTQRDIDCIKKANVSVRVSSQQFEEKPTSSVRAVRNTRTSSSTSERQSKRSRR